MGLVFNLKVNQPSLNCASRRYSPQASLQMRFSPCFYAEQKGIVKGRKNFKLQVLWLLISLKKSILDVLLWLSAPSKLHVFLSLFMFIKVYNPSNSASDHFYEKKIVCGIEYDAKTAAIKFYCDHTIPKKLEQRWPTPGLVSLSLNISCSGC